VQAHQRLLKPEIEENRIAPWRGRLPPSAGAAREDTVSADCDEEVDAAAGRAVDCGDARPALAAAGIV
jgi:hypothetical protein